MTKAKFGAKLLGMLSRLHCLSKVVSTLRLSLPIALPVPVLAALTIAMAAATPVQATVQSDVQANLQAGEQSVFHSAVQTTVAGRKPLAIVYYGEGACPEGCAQSAREIAVAAGYEVELISPQNWNTELFKSASIYIQPGGKSYTLTRVISETQKEDLRSFVRGGGGYVGFCAGAFFASRMRLPEEGHPERVSMLGLLDMESQIYPAQDKGLIFKYSWLNTFRFFYWEGGPMLKPIGAAEVISRYPTGEVAAARGTYGKGKVIVSAFHPEAPQGWRDYFKLEDPDGLDFDIARDMMLWATPASLDRH